MVRRVGRASCGGQRIVLVRDDLAQPERVHACMALLCMPQAIMFLIELSVMGLLPAHMVNLDSVLGSSQ